MRLLVAMLLFLPALATPEQSDIEIEWWVKDGSPCSTRTDRIEGTCFLDVRQPKGRRK